MKGPLRRFGWLVAALCAVAGPIAGCSDGKDATSPAASGRTAPSVAASAEEEIPTPGRPVRPPEPIDLPALRCPPELSNCETASGQILFVERVDPDGDGDAHFVLLSGEGITAPGISIVDVRPDLRPRPLPGRGDLLVATGPVYEGSVGQRQIEAIEVVFEGRRG